MPRKVSVENIAKRKEQILKGAITAFARKGMKSTSMNDIVRESGLSKGAIYWYYKSKDEIISELINSFFDSNAIKALDQSLSTGSAVERINKLIEYDAELVGKLKPLRPVILEIYMVAFRDPKIKKITSRTFQDSTALIEKIIAYGVRSEEFRRVDPREIAIAIIEIMEGAMIWFINTKDFDYIEHVRYGINLIIDSIKVKK